MHWKISRHGDYRHEFCNPNADIFETNSTNNLGGPHHPKQFYLHQYSPMIKSGFQ